jgi:glutathione S-transferase
MKPHVELHGHETCPFAWRTRLVALEKGVPFDWIPCDVERPDPRAQTHNAAGLSPVLIHDWLTLTESLVIGQYLDEVFPGRSLEPEDPARRALERLAMHEIDLEFARAETPGPDTPEAARRAFAALETRLREGPWLGGERPSLLDLHVIPMLAATVLRLRIPVPDDHGHVRAYWERVQKLASFQKTRPPWAR